MATSKGAFFKKNGPLQKAEFDSRNRQTEASMKYGHIDPEYLMKLLMECKMERARFGVDYKISDPLAIAIEYAIKKTMGFQCFRRYSDDWKEAMEFHARYLTIKHIHNFDPEKLKKVSKNNDPYYYIGTMIKNAFLQVIAKLKKKSKYLKFTSLNENILSSCGRTDQYEGVLEREEKRLAEERDGESGLHIDTDDPMPDDSEQVEATIKELKAKKPARKTARTARKRK